MQIVGIVGFIGSGKNTVGEMLQKEGFTPMSFAATLKDATSAIFGWPRHLLEGDTKESRDFREQPDSFWSEKLGYEMTPRKALQLMGTEAGRNVFGENLWVDSVFKKMYDSQQSKFVITDVRFENEIESLRSVGGKVYLVNRGPAPVWFSTAILDKSGVKIPGLDNKRMKDLYPEVHISEWDWIISEFDGVIDNNGDLNHLENEVRKIILNEGNDKK